MTKYLTRVEVLALHGDQIARYGGAEGVRDFGLLEAALYRPQTGHYRDVVSEAAALWESLSQNRPFMNGNRRTAFAAAYTFLRLNGIVITAECNVASGDIVGWYESGRFAFDVLEPWLRANTRPI